MEKRMNEIIMLIVVWIIYLPNTWLLLKFELWYCIIKCFHQNLSIDQNNENLCHISKNLSLQDSYCRGVVSWLHALYILNMLHHVSFWSGYYKIVTSWCELLRNIYQVLLSPYWSLDILRLVNQVGSVLWCT